MRASNWPLRIVAPAIALAVGLASAGGGAAAMPPPGAITHIMVIDLENEDYDQTFGPASPAVYLNTTLLRQGELIVNYFATSHVSLGNYIAQVSGQGPNETTNDDCIDLATYAHPPVLGRFAPMDPGADAADQALYPGQVVGKGCVYPAPTATTRGARTIGDQLDAAPERPGAPWPSPRWREYAEDMGEDNARDLGQRDPMGGADCAHPALGEVDLTNRATAGDQYANRHNPFVWFRSVIDDGARCDAHVTPLGRVAVGRDGGADVFSGHLFEDLRHAETTPAFLFVTPNLCDDGHDAVCVGPNVEGLRRPDGRFVGGLAAADQWLKHWMPMIFASPAYQSGAMLVILTFDESDLEDARACPARDQSACGAPSGPNVSNYGFSRLLAMMGKQTPPTAPGVYPGGGQIGAVAFNRRFIRPGSVNATGVYTHFSALRAYEDLLGIVAGGDDGRGHLGQAARAGVTGFGADVFNAEAP
jgi:hypothetical protein